MEVEEKRKKFLQNIQTWPYTYISEKYFQNCGPGIIKKFKRLLLFPSIYLPYSFWRLGLYKKNREVEAKLFFGKSIKLPLVDPESFYLYFFGLLGGPIEIKLTKFFIKNFRKDDIFYDVGANWGFYTYLALEFCKEVHSFEPLPHIFENLSKNLGNETKCFLNNLALTNFGGISTMYVGKSSGKSTIRGEIFKESKELFEKKISVKTTTLDDYLKVHHPPTIIKLDVEGAENLVIEGGKELFKNFSPLIAMEILAQKDGIDNAHEKAIELLKEFGYKIFFLTQEGDLKEINENLFRKLEKDGLTHDNFIFLKQ